MLDSISRRFSNDGNQNVVIDCCLSTTIVAADQTQIVKQLFIDTHFNLCEYDKKQGLKTSLTERAIFWLSKRLYYWLYSDKAYAITSYFLKELALKRFHNGLNTEPELLQQDHRIIRDSIRDQILIYQDRIDPFKVIPDVQCLKKEAVIQLYQQLLIKTEEFPYLNEIPIDFSQISEITIINELIQVLDKHQLLLKARNDKKSFQKLPETNCLTAEPINKSESESVCSQAKTIEKDPRLETRRKKIALLNPKKTLEKPLVQSPVVNQTIQRLFTIGSPLTDEVKQKIEKRGTVVKHPFFENQAFFKSLAEKNDFYAGILLPLFKLLSYLLAENHENCEGVYQDWKKQIDHIGAKWIESKSDKSEIDTLIYRSTLERYWSLENSRLLLELLAQLEINVEMFLKEFQKLHIPSVLNLNLDLLKEKSVSLLSEWLSNREERTNLIHCFKDSSTIQNWPPHFQFLLILMMSNYNSMHERMRDDSDYRKDLREKLRLSLNHFDSLITSNLIKVCCSNNFLVKGTVIFALKTFKESFFKQEIESDYFNRSNKKIKNKPQKYSKEHIEFYKKIIPFANTEERKYFDQLNKKLVSQIINQLFDQFIIDNHQKGLLNIPDFVQLIPIYTQMLRAFLIYDEALNTRDPHKLISAETTLIQAEIQFILGLFKRMQLISKVLLSEKRPSYQLLLKSLDQLFCAVRKNPSQPVEDKDFLDSLKIYLAASNS